MCHAVRLNIIYSFKCEFYDVRNCSKRDDARNPVCDKPNNSSPEARFVSSGFWNNLGIALFHVVNDMRS